jgi:hypothetical protein
MKKIKLPGERKAFEILTENPLKGKKLYDTEYNKYKAKDFKPNKFLGLDLNTKGDEKVYKLMKDNKLTLYSSPDHSFFLKKAHDAYVEGQQEFCKQAKIDWFWLNRNRYLDNLTTDLGKGYERNNLTNYVTNLRPWDSDVDRKVFSKDVKRLYDDKEKYIKLQKGLLKTKPGSPEEKKYLGTYEKTMDNMLIDWHNNMAALAKKYKSDRAEDVSSSAKQIAKTFGKKAGYTREQNIADLKRLGEGFNTTSNIMMGLGLGGIGGGTLLGTLGKRPGLGTALGIGGGITGLLGLSGKRYPKSLDTIAKYLKDKKLSDDEWGDLALNNPSSSLWKHVHPDYRGNAQDKLRSAKVNLYK